MEGQDPDLEKFWQSCIGITQGMQILSSCSGGRSGACDLEHALGAEDLEHATHALNFDDTSPRGNLVDVSHAEDLEHAFRAEDLEHATHALNFDDPISTFSRSSLPF